MTGLQLAAVGGILLGLALIVWAVPLADAEGRRHRREASAAERSLPGRWGKAAGAVMRFGADDDRASREQRYIGYRVVGLVCVVAGVAALLGTWS